MSKKNQYKQERDASKIPVSKTSEYVKSYNQQYYLANKEKIKKREKDWRANNGHQKSERDKRYREQNREKKAKRDKKYREENKDKLKAQHKEWYISNKQHVHEYQVSYRKERSKKDILFALKMKLRNCVLKAFKRIGNDKPTNTLKLLGCDWETARAHFESLFKEGMSWENHGEWHIDHIRPVTSFTEEDMHLMNHISNLQPLWADENLKKSSKIL